MVDRKRKEGKMKKQMIELDLLDDLLREYKQMKNKGEAFSDFIRVSKTVFDDKPAVFDWVYVNERYIEKVIEEED